MTPDDVTYRFRVRAAAARLTFTIRTSIAGGHRQGVSVLRHCDLASAAESSPSHFHMYVFLPICPALCCPKTRRAAPEG